MQEFIKIYNLLKKRAYFLEGLIVAIIVYLYFVNYLSKIDFGQYHLSQLQSFFISLLGTLIISGGWLFLRRVPKFKNDTIGVIFAPHTNEKLSEELDSLLLQVDGLLSNFNLDNKFKIVKLPENIKVTNTPEAEKIRNKSRCHLLIWGLYEKGQINGQEFGGFRDSQLNFTYAVPNHDFMKEISRDISLSLQRRRWLYKSSNELIERDFIVKNIADVARYIIGTSLFNFRSFESSKAILKEILSKPYGTWDGNAKNNVLVFLNNIKSKLARIDTILAGNIYNKSIFVEGHFQNNPNTLDKVIALTSASIKNFATIDSYLLKAIALFLKGEINSSITLMQKAVKRWPTNPNPYFSLAFLYAFSGNLPMSKRNYRRAFALTPINKNIEYIDMSEISADIFHIIEFQEACLEIYPDKYHLHFSLGLLNNEFLDPRSALNHFQNFVGIARQTSSENDSRYITEADIFIEKNLNLAVGVSGADVKI